MIYSLVDFGSTFTKIALVDGRGQLLATSQHPTTVQTDVVDGYEQALDLAAASAGLPRTAIDRVVAASSAAGGLRMAAVGLVDDLTAAAARRAALSAGARVDGVWSGAFSTADQAALRALAPDVILFAGGTDGGQRQRVLDNARAVAAAGSGADIVVACNVDVANAVQEEFAGSGHHVVVVDNVLPAVDRERLGPVREVIRRLFIERVIRAKGISTASTFLDAVVMPTPAAVLSCAELIAGDASAGRAVLIVDVGGATTDVHSVLSERPRSVRTGRSAPPPSRSLRTVEGDLGVRWNADTVCALDADRFRSENDATALAAAITLRKNDPAFVPTTDADRAFDRLLATSCISIALERHVGRLSTHYVVGQGAEVVLAGRDLREADVVLLTGGSVVRSGVDALALSEDAISRLDLSRPVPRASPVVVDENYVLAAIGLLATVNRGAALQLMREQVPGLAAAVAA